MVRLNFKKCILFYIPYIIFNTTTLTLAPGTAKRQPSPIGIILKYIRPPFFLFPQVIKINTV